MWPKDRWEKAYQGGYSDAAMRNDAAIDTPFLQRILHVLTAFVYDLSHVINVMHLAFGNGVGHDSRTLPKKLRSGASSL